MDVFGEYNFYCEQRKSLWLNNFELNLSRERTYVCACGDLFVLLLLYYYY